MTESTVSILTGTLRVPFRENAAISKKNVLAGRSFDEGWLPAVHVPHPALPPVVTLSIPGGRDD